MYVPDKNALTFKLQINPQYKSHKRRKKVRQCILNAGCQIPSQQSLLHFVKAPCSSNFFLKCLNVLLSVVCYSFRSSRTSILIISLNICISFFSNHYLLIASHVKITQIHSYYLHFFPRPRSPKKEKKIFNVLLFVFCYLFKSSGIFIQLSPLTLHSFLFKLSSPR